MLHISENHPASLANVCSATHDKVDALLISCAHWVLVQRIATICLRNYQLNCNFQAAGFSFSTLQHDACPPCSELPPTLSTLKPHDPSDALAPITSSASVWQPKLPAVSEHPTQPHTAPEQQHVTQPPHPNQQDHLLGSRQHPQDSQLHPLTSGQLQRPCASTSPFDTSLSAPFSQHAPQGGHYTPAQQAGASGSVQQPGYRDAAAQTHMQMQQQQQLNIVEREPVSGATDSGGYAHDHRLSRNTASITVCKQQTIWRAVFMFCQYCKVLSLPGWRHEQQSSPQGCSTSWLSCSPSLPSLLLQVSLAVSTRSWLTRCKQPSRLPPRRHRQTLLMACLR